MSMAVSVTWNLGDEDLEGSEIVYCILHLAY